MEDTRSPQTKIFHRMIHDYLGHTKVESMNALKKRLKEERRKRGIKPKKNGKGTMKPIDVRGW